MSLLLRSLRSIRSDPLVCSSSILVRRRGFVVDFVAAVAVVDFAVVRMIYLFLLRLLIKLEHFQYDIATVILIT